MSSEPVADVQPQEKVLVISIRKSLLDESTTRELCDEVLTAAVETPRLPIVLDMAQVRFAPSVALGALVRLSNSFKLDGRRIMLIGVDLRIRGTIRVTRLDQVLEIYETLPQVLTQLARTA